MRTQTILVPIDFSDNAQVAVEKGCELALQLGAKLYLLHVQDESTLTVRTFLQPVPNRLENNLCPDGIQCHLSSLMGSLWLPISFRIPR